jgi:hypothetical protein
MVVRGTGREANAVLGGRWKRYDRVQKKQTDNQKA